MRALDSLRVWRDATAQKDDWIREARDEGASVPEIMEASGLSRAMVYRVLNGK